MNQNQLYGEAQIQAAERGMAGSDVAIGYLYDQLVREQALQRTASDMTSGVESSRQTGSIEEMQGGPDLGSIERSVLPTGDAVDNMTEAASAQQIASAAPVINNITNNNTNPTSKPILTNPVTPRSVDSSLERLQNQRSIFLMG